MHSMRAIVNSLFVFIFPAFVSQAYLKSMPSRKVHLSLPLQIAATKFQEILRQCAENSWQPGQLPYSYCREEGLRSRGR
jgi:hypothetical protein